MSRRRLTVGLVQMRMGSSFTDNLDRALGWVERAADEGAQVVCLPELFVAPYFPQHEGTPGELGPSEWVDTVPGKATEALGHCARRNGVAIVGGSVHEVDGGRLFNTCAVLDSRGRMLGKYRKTHIPHDEHFFEQHYFEKGDTGFQVFDLGPARVGTLICYDQWFPEAARCLALMGAEVIFYPTAIGTVRGIRQREGSWHQAWENVMRGHAIANAVVVCAANRCGREEGMSFWGGGFVCDAFGRTLGRAGRGEGVLVRRVDLDHGREIREGWGFFENRRPECYARLVQEV